MAAQSWKSSGELMADPSWRDELDFSRWRRLHVQLGAGDSLDERVRRPRALLELQLTPLDLQRVALAVHALERHEQLARAMLRVDGAGGGEQHAGPQHDDGDGEELGCED